MNRPIILASTSVYRKAILEKLAIPFVCCAPDIDEQPLASEPAEALVVRLAVEKAKAAARNYTSGLVIGSDQVAVIGNTILGKPHDHTQAIKQLQQSSGQTVRFMTGLCLLDVATGEYQALMEPFDVHFKSLTNEQIENYLYLEEPYQCAGSFKSEAAGIALFSKLQGDDPNTLVGLPLIRLVELLAAQGVDVLQLAINQQRIP